LGGSGDSSSYGVGGETEFVEFRSGGGPARIAESQFLTP